MRLTFLIPTRNRRDAVARCLRSILRADDADREIVVVDDASEDGTPGMIAEEFPTVRLLRNEQRMGVGGAHARGLAEATGEVIVCLDDDAWIVSGPPEPLVRERFAAVPDLGALCFRVEAPDGSVRHREIPLRNKRLPDAETEIGYFLGGGVALRAEALRDAGGFAAHIAYGSEELDLAFRLFKCGWRMIFDPSVRVAHEAVPSPQNTTEREPNYVRGETGIAARYLPTPYAQVHAVLWWAQLMREASRTRNLGRTTSAVGESLTQWRRLRADREHRLTLAEAARLTRLSGRTWY